MTERKPRYSQSQNRATQAYQDKNLEQVRFWVQKGERDVLKTVADEEGVSMAAYLVRAVNAYAGRQLLTPSDGKPGRKPANE